MNGEYRVKNEELRDLYRQACDLRARFDGPVTIRHVRRAQNQCADQLCNEALDGKRLAIPRRWRNSLRRASPAAKTISRGSLDVSTASGGRSNDLRAEQVWQRLVTILQRHGLTVPASER